MVSITRERGPQTATWSPGLISSLKTFFVFGHPAEVSPSFRLRRPASEHLTYFRWVIVGLNYDFLRKRRDATMLRTGIVSAVACAIMFTAIGASPASAQMIDRAGERCGKALVTAKFQQEGPKREVDVEVYATSRGEKWRVEIRDESGKLLHRINRTTGRDFAFDVWRYVPPQTTQVDVSLSGPAGQGCSISLTAS